MTTIPSNFEYLALLLLGLALGWLFFGSRTLRLAGKPEFWVGLLLYLGVCAWFDFSGLRLGWFQFDSTRILGITVFTVPVEEYLLFAQFYFFTAVAWETFNELA